MRESVERVPTESGRWATEQAGADGPAQWLITFGGTMPVSHERTGMAVKGKWRSIDDILPTWDGLNDADDRRLVRLATSQPRPKPGNYRKHQPHE